MCLWVGFNNALITLINIAISQVSDEKKKVSSTGGMENSVKTRYEVYLLY